MIITKNNNKIGFLIFERRGDDSGTGEVSVDGRDIDGPGQLHDSADSEMHAADRTLHSLYCIYVSATA